MKGKIVTHAKLQYYRHNYCLVCMTGLLGCRWHRYQQSTRENRKRDLANLVLVLLAYLYMLAFFYFWLVMRNNVYHITLNMYHRLGKYVPWYTLGLGFSCTAFAYQTVIVLLSVLHVWHGHQLYIHPIHLVLAVIVLVSCIVVSVLVKIYWTWAWPLVYISLQVYGPFLQLTAVIVMTALSWIICRQWFKLRHKVVRYVWLLVFVLAMLGLYVSPLLIKSPLVRSTTPDKPQIVAVGGASDIAPENTLHAFRKAHQLGVKALLTTVQISKDGQPFLFKDTSLLRTTDAAVKFAGNKTFDPVHYEMNDLLTLDAGSWFLENDPWGTAGELSSSEKDDIRRQTIPTLDEFLQFMRESQARSVVVLFHFRALSKDHLHYSRAESPTSTDFGTGAIVKNSLASSGVDLSRFYTPVTSSGDAGTLGLLERYVSDSDYVNKTQAKMGLIHIPDLSQSSIRGFQSLNVSTVAMSVDSAWLLSYAWCTGSDMVATHYVRAIQSVEDPIWHLNDKSYLGLWITIDCISAVLIIIMFIVQRIRLYGTNFSPESMSLNTGRSKTSYRSRTMKEKLLREGAVIDAMDDLEVIESGGVVNQPVYSMTSGHQAYSLTSLPHSGAAAPGMATEGVVGAGSSIVVTPIPAVTTERCDV